MTSNKELLDLVTKLKKEVRRLKKELREIKKLEKRRKSPDYGYGLSHNPFPN